MVGVLSVAVVVGVLTMRPTVILLPEEDLLRVRCAAYSLALSGGASAVAVVGSAAAVREAISKTGAGVQNVRRARGKVALWPQNPKRVNTATDNCCR